MKKILPVFLSFLFVILVSACGLNPSNQNTPGEDVVDNRDKIVPELTCHEPDTGAVDVAVDANMKLCFSEDMKLDAASYGKAFQLLDDQQVLVEANGTYNSADHTYIIDPKENLKAKTIYTLRVKTGSTPDLAGNALNAPLKLEFTTK